FFTETLKRYPHCSFKMWEEGINNKLFYPQFHGREHLNVNRWMYFLQCNEEVRSLFDMEVFGINGNRIGNKTYQSFVPALEVDAHTTIEDTNSVLKEGLSIFKNIFKYSSYSFIAPNYIWAKENEDLLNNEGVKIIQGVFHQKCPIRGKKFHYLGEKNEYNQIYTIRNIIFEPSDFIKKDWVSSCLKEIDRSFRLKKPAVICSHRVNFIGGIFEENRTKNLELFKS